MNRGQTVPRLAPWATCSRTSGAAGRELSSHSSPTFNHSLLGLASETGAGCERVAGEEFLYAQASSAFALQLEDAKGLLAAAHNDPLFVSAQNLARHGREFRFNLGEPDLQQLRFAILVQMREGTGPRREAAHTIPQDARRLRPIDLAVFLGDFPGVGSAFRRLRDGRDPALGVVRDRFHQQFATQRRQPIVQIGRASCRERVSPYV